MENQIEITKTGIALIEIENVMTNITDILEAAKLVANRKNKTYAYCAKLIKFINAHKIERIFHDVVDFTNNANGWKLEINSEFLKQLKSGDIIEIVINMKSSSKYSYHSKTFLKVINNADGNITVYVANTALCAFINFIWIK